MTTQDETRGPLLRRLFSDPASRSGLRPRMARPLTPEERMALQPAGTITDPLARIRSLEHCYNEHAATLESLRDTLWPPADPEQQWSADTIAAVADILDRAGYGPPEPAGDVAPDDARATCPTCGKVGPADEHPCSFGRACSCWYGIECQDEGDPRDLG